MAALMTFQPTQWADLLPELLGRVIARLPFPDDLARFRAVCRPWHSAVREHACPEVPWIIHSDGTFVTTYDYGFHRRIPFPDNTRFIGVDGSWLALYCTDDSAIDGQRSYLLHNPFTKTTVPLPGLDSIIGKVVSARFKIRKVLMRDDGFTVAVTTNNSKYPVILCRPGKHGAWFPQQGDTSCASIYDVAFHGGNLYGITVDNELLVLSLDEDDDGTPTVTSVECVIDYMPGDDDDDDDDEVVEEEEEGDGEAPDNGYQEEAEYDDEEEEEANEDDGEYEYEEEAECSDASSSFDEEYINNNHDGEYVSSSNEDETDTSNGLDEYYEDNNEAKSNTLDDDDDDDDDAKYFEGDRFDHDECDVDMPRNHPRNYTVTTRRLIESDGKLLMLRRQQRILHSSDSYTFDVEVLEADMSAGEWVPTDMTGTLYVSDRNSTYVPAPSDDEENELAWYFADEHDVIDPESQTSEEIIRRISTWFFPQEFVAQ